MFLQLKVTGTGRLGELVKPLFPRYLFVKITGQWRFLNGTFGVSHVLLGDDGRPGILPAKYITELKGCEGEDGLVQLGERPETDVFKVGEEVRFTGGSFWGIKGVYGGSSDRERATVLMDFLGRKTSVVVSRKDLERAGE